MASILCLGISSLDYLFRVENIETAPAKIMAQNYAQVTGGMAAAAAVAIARLGGEAHYWGRLGDDPVGDRIVADLASAGVTVGGVGRVPGARSPVAAVLIDKRGERLVCPYYDPALDPDPGWLPIEQLDRYDAVLADVRWPAGAQRGLAAAKARGVVAMLDADVAARDVLGALLPCATHIIFSEPALLSFCRENELTKALESIAPRYPATVGVTAGARGFFWVETGNVRHAPAPTVDAVDTLAAGDVFHGAFTLALAEGNDIEACAKFANAAAAIKCTRFGGCAAAPTRAEVMRLLG